ncbi:MAG: hypothetical protein KDE04_17420 [Anaerolineales bacterium]|nr:hypothetical protein [Anaerolineales bacterium]
MFRAKASPRLLLFLLLLLAACQPPTPAVTPTASPLPTTGAELIFTPTATTTIAATATPLPTTVSATSISITAAATSTALPTATSQPAFTRTPTPGPIPLPPLPTGLETPIPFGAAIGTPLPPQTQPITAANVSLLAETGRWGKGRILQAIYSPDGASLYVLTEQGLYLYETATATQLTFWPFAGSAMQAMALSPDGTMLALLAASEVPFVELRAAADFRFLAAFYPFPNVQRELRELHFGPDSQTLFVASWSWVARGSRQPGQLAAWDAATLTHLGTLGEVDEMTGISSQFTFAASLFNEAEVRLYQWGSAGFQLLQTWPVPDELQMNGKLALAPDGSLLAVSAAHGISFAVIDTEEGELLYMLNEPERPVAGKPAAVSGPGRGYINSLVFNSDGSLLGATTGYQDLLVWQAATGQRQQRLDRAGAELTFAPTGALVATWQHSLSQWRLADGSQLNSLRQHFGAIADLAVLPGRPDIAIASADGYLYFRHGQTGELVSAFRAGVSNEGGFIPPAVQHLSVAADGSALAIASNDNFWHYDLATGNATTYAHPPRSDIGANDVAMAPDGSFILSSNHDNPAMIQYLGDEEWHFTNLYQPSILVASPKDPIFAVANYSLPALLWNWVTEELIELPDDELSATGDFIEMTAAAFSPDGQLLAMGTNSNHLVVWDQLDGEPVMRWFMVQSERHRPVWAVAFSPGGSLLVAASESWLYFWDPAGQLLFSLDTGRSITSLAFATDGSRLYSGHTDGTVRGWQVP